MDERAPLLLNQESDTNTSVAKASQDNDRRWAIFRFLEAKTPGGRIYEIFMIALILINILALIVGSLFDTTYNPVDWASRESGICNNLCDALWFGNYRDNGVASWLRWADKNTSTSVLEVFTILVFTVEYIMRLVVADLESPQYKGFVGRLRYIPTFFSLVDLASTLPFYIDAFIIRTNESNTSSSTSFLRMFRLVRMMRVEGRYDNALTLVDDVYRDVKGVLGTALFIGLTTWISVSSLYYLTERRNLDMVYCPGNCGLDDDIDTSLCSIDYWGLVDCSNAGCTENSTSFRDCYNLFQSIPSASYYSLLNLFGEFPLIDQHSAAGKVVGTLTAVVAVVVFALPVGIIGNGFETVIAKRNAKRLKKEQQNGVDDGNNTAGPIVEKSGLTPNFHASEATLKGRLYNFLHAMSTPWARRCDDFINFLVLCTALTFMVDTLISNKNPRIHIFMDWVEFVAVVCFTVEYVLRVYSIQEDPKYGNNRFGRLLYASNFLSIVDLLSFLPYWIYVAVSGAIISSKSGSTSNNVVMCLRLLRIFRFERYTHAFLSFDDVIRRNLDVLTVTAFSAFLIWVLFAFILYLTERENPDEEMSNNYNTIPNSMWITLLNLSGESPIAQYSVAGKLATGILGLFATGIFGIPIGVLGAGFEEVVKEENEDNANELANDDNAREQGSMTLSGSVWEQEAYKFVNGIGSKAAQLFELSIYVLIFLTVAVGVLQTVHGHEDTLHQVEWIAVIVFTFEYFLRLCGAGADPEYAKQGNCITRRLLFIISFYSIVDLLAIIPFYIVVAMPSSIVNDYDEYLRMVRIVRLVKLDKYVPSISLIDDVVRLKYKALAVALYAAVTLWILFAALLYLFEHYDLADGIDPVPKYGCYDDCTMVDRFQNYFDSLVYTGIHLTGDYPIVTYSWPSRIVNFFMVIAAVGVVSVPSGLIASGFVEIVQSRNKKLQGEELQGRAGDDWYDQSYRDLEGSEAPPSRFGPAVDKWQVAVNKFLNGTKDSNGNTQWTNCSYFGRVFMFTLIIANVVAVMVESIPNIDRAVGNQPGNFFDSFEAFSVMIFAAEYGLRLFCARKNREALYSPIVYATTFFGIVDLLSTAPWFIEQAMIATGTLYASSDSAKIFRIFRVFRILQLEDFVTAFSKLDNVFRASIDVFRATALMAIIIWVGCGALFYIFEQNNPNWRQCDASIPLHSSHHKHPGCYDFPSTSACNEFYPGLCSQNAFTNMPNTLYYTAVFLAGEWGVVDFTWPGRLVCLFLCIVGIALYAIPVGILFDSFGSVLGLATDDDDDIPESDAEANVGNNDDLVEKQDVPTGKVLS